MSEPLSHMPQLSTNRQFFPITPECARWLLILCASLCCCCPSHCVRSLLHCSMAPSSALKEFLSSQQHRLHSLNGNGIGGGKVHRKLAEISRGWEVAIQPVQNLPEDFWPAPFTNNSQEDAAKLLEKPACKDVISLLNGVSESIIQFHLVHGIAIFPHAKGLAELLFLVCGEYG